MSFKLIRKRGPVSKKAQVEVITVMLILAITVAAVFAAYRFAGPQIERSRDVSRITSMQNALLELDKKIREVRFEGEGAQRYIDINFDKGNISVDQNDDTVWFYMDAPGIEIAPQQMGMDTYFNGRSINIKLQYGGEIDILSRFEVLNFGQYRIYIKNEGANDVLLSLSPEIPVTGDTWTLQGYVYDNTEGQTTESNPIMNTTGDTIDPPLANAEIVFINDKLETIAITRTSSQGRYAVKLPKSDGPNDLKLYVCVNLSSYVMKEIEVDKYVNTNQYEKGFILNSGPWEVNMYDLIATPKNDFEIYYDDNDFFNIPMYKLTKQDIFESVPIAVILYTGGTISGEDYRLNNDLDYLLYDVMDAFDSSSTSNYHCSYFVVYGGFDENTYPNGLGLQNSDGSPINYIDTGNNVRIYPISWLLDPTKRKSPSDYSPLDSTKFRDIAMIDGNPDILNYRDFSLIVVSSGATNDSNLLPKLNAYRGDLSNFLALNRLSFKGVDYSRGLITFGQFSIVDGVDPDSLNYFPYPSLVNDLTPPRVTNVNIVPDGQSVGAPLVQHPYVWINGDGGKVNLYSNIKDTSSIIHAGANVKKDDDIVAGTFLFDDGRAPDRISGDSTYSAELILQGGLSEGIYQVSVESTDEYGNVFNPSDTLSTYQFELKIDTSPANSSLLTSSILSPTTSPYTKLTYSVSDDSSGIDRSTYNDQVLSYEGNPLRNDPHSYYHYLTLSDYSFNYSVITYDKAQNPSPPLNIVIIKDTSPPDISDQYIPQGTITTGTPEIRVDYNDDGAGIRGSRLYLDGVNTNANVSGSSMISYTPLSDEANGSHTASVYIEDDLGNFLVFPWSFDIKMPGPNLNINDPQPFLTFTNNPSKTISGTTSTDRTIYLDINGSPVFSTAGPNFNFVGVSLDNGLNIIELKADGFPDGDENNTVVTRWLVLDNTPPSISILDPTIGNPQNVKTGGKAYVTFTYTEKYPASYTIKLLNGGTFLGQTSTAIKDPNVDSVQAGGTHIIMGIIDIPNTVSDGLYDIEIIMTDLAGNVSLAATANDIIRVKNSGPSISNPSPANNAPALPTDPISVTITDEYAGVDRNSIRMFILGQSNDNVSVINLDVTDNLVIGATMDGYGYTVTYQPTWAWENTKKINVSVEASDKLGNKTSDSWYYITSSQVPDINNLSLDNRAAEKDENGDPYIVRLSFDVTQCSDNPDTYDAIKEINISIGKLGYIKYVSDGVAGKSKLVRTDDSLAGDPPSITVDHIVGGCTGSNLFTYNFKNLNQVTFTVPEYAGDLNNKVFITAVNSEDWQSTYETYLITSKQKYVSSPNTYYYGKYSWLPTFQGQDLSIGRVSNEPVGLNYKIYGQVNDAHRNIPVMYTAWQKIKHGNTIEMDQWSGGLYIDKDDNRIEWDHGRIPSVFKFDIEGRPGSVWPPGKPFQQNTWLTLDMNLGLSNRQYNLQKSSLESPIVNRMYNEFAMCTHNYFDITDTGWTNNNVIISLKTFEKIYQEKGDPLTVPISSNKTYSGGTIFAPQAAGGPVLLVKERRNIFNSLESTIVVTTLDLDRYKNNRNATYGKNMHPNEVYSGDARRLQQNIIVYACGHELLID
ncbi:MAG TPA: hypothetical protein PLI06_02025 [Methanofastidiosum sp.]|nr:hypothetical protein [Methanofastidiosum sp.]